MATRPELIGPGGTLEVEDRAVGSPPAGAEPSAGLVILHHGDLRRVGEVFELPPEVLVEVGRSAPRLTGRDGERRPLNDPAISSSTLSVYWRPGPLRFEVEPSASARRMARFYSPELEPLALGPNTGGTLGAGSVIEIDGRALLGLWINPFPGVPRIAGLAGESAAAHRLRDEIRRLAPLKSTVLVTGETGSGKEVVAHALHTSGRGGERPFIVVNCGAMPSALLESELFGHVRGAFTGAVADQRGLIRSAEGGTLFLDEIGELPLELQVKLLRVLRGHRVRPVGGTQEVPVDVRFVCATNRDLDAEVRAGRFREDLFYRVAALGIHVPPLRERRLDIPLLFARELLTEGQGSGLVGALTRGPASTSLPLSTGAIVGLMADGWPGNVTELKSYAVRTVAQVTSLEDIRLPARPAAPLSRTSHRAAAGISAPPSPSERPLARPLTRPLTREDLEPHLRAHAFEVAAVARALGVQRNTVYDWMARTGIRVAESYSPDELRAAIAEQGGDEVAAAHQLLLSHKALRRRLGPTGDA